MKSRLLIIIGILIAISVSALIIIDNIEDQSTLEPTPPTMEEIQSNLDKTQRETHEPSFKKGQFPAPSGLGILHALSVADKEKLQNVLDNCDCQESGQTPCKLPRLSYQNDTHSIDNLDCEWVTISNEERDVKLAAGYKLYPGVGWVAPADQNTMEPIYRIHPETGEKVIDLDAMILAQKILDKYKDMPEVVAFYAKYDDAQASVREDHVSYFAGSDNDALMRMNIFFDENQTISEIDTHCYFQNVHQYEISQEDIVNIFEKYDCKK